MSQLDTPGNQTLALAGVFQSVHLCKSLATTGMCSQDELDATLGSILTVDTDRVVDAYGGSPEALKPGLRVLSNQLGGRGEARDLDIARYTLLLVQLGSNVMNDPNTIEQLKIGIELTHEPVVGTRSLHSHSERDPRRLTVLCECVGV